MVFLTVIGVLKYAEIKYNGKSGWMKILTSEKYAVPLKEWIPASFL